MESATNSDVAALLRINANFSYIKLLFIQTVTPIQPTDRTNLLSRIT